MRKLFLVIALLAAVAARAEQKNVQLLTKLSDAQLGQAMDNMAASLGVHCNFCHAAVEHSEHLDFPSDAKKEKKTAREMIRMVIDLNEKSFGGHTVVGCYTCHLGKENPSLMVALPVPSIPPSKPDTEEADRKTYPAAKDLSERYVTAIGGEGAAKKLGASMTAKATRTASNGQSMPMEVYRSGGSVLLRATPAEGPAMVQMYGAEGGWMTGGQGQGTRTMTAADAALRLASARAYDPFMGPLPDKARVTGKETIEGHEAWSVVALIDEHTRQRLWFDATTGLVLRRVVTIDSPVGRIPTQTDYDDYRDVAGVKVPFTVRVSGVNGGSTRKYTSIELGAPVDEKVFAQPK